MRLSTERAIEAAVRGWLEEYGDPFAGDLYSSMRNPLFAEIERIFFAVYPEFRIEGDGEHLGSPQSLPAGVRAEILDRDNHSCLACGSCDSLHIDHIWPRSHGGDDESVNLMTLCASCNIAKSDKHPISWLHEIPQRTTILAGRIFNAVEHARERGVSY